MTLAASSPPRVPPPRTFEREHVVLRPVDWETYVRLNERNARRSLKMTYTDGSLEIMAPRRDHSVITRFLDHVVTATAEETGTPAVSYRDATWKRADLEKGLEADDCFYIQHARLADEMGVNMSIPENPPPDLAIETDITHSDLDKESVYAALGVPELWRWDDGTLRIRLLGADGRYADAEASRALPLLKGAEIQRWVQRRLNEGEWSTRQAFRQWVRQQHGGQGSVGE